MKIAKSSRGIYEPVLSEEDVLCRIRTLLELNGARVFRAIERVPKCYRCGCWLGFSEPGTPDLNGYFYTPGRVLIPFWLEVKRAKGKRRSAQIARIDLIREDGGCAAIVESWEEALHCLEKFGWHSKVV
jgi:hypothetical protein